MKSIVTKNKFVLRREKENKFNREIKNTKIKSNLFNKKAEYIGNEGQRLEVWA